MKRSRIRNLFVLGALAAAMVGAQPAPASAAGTSPRIFNCYTQWWSTAWAQKCAAPGAQWTGTYQSSIHCAGQGRRYLTAPRVQGSKATYKGADCTFSASGGQITYY